MFDRLIVLAGMGLVGTVLAEGSAAWGLGGYMPVVNTLMTAYIILAGTIGALWVLRNSKTWTGPSLRAAIDQLQLENGQIRRAMKADEMERNQLRFAIEESIPRRFDAVNERLTAVDEAMMGQLNELKTSLDRFMALHKDCPLNREQ